MICRRLAEQDKVFYLDPFLLKVKYWGYMDNVQIEFKILIFIIIFILL